MDTAGGEQINEIAKESSRLQNIPLTFSEKAGHVGNVCTTLVLWVDSHSQHQPGPIRLPNI